MLVCHYSYLINLIRFVDSNGLLAFVIEGNSALRTQDYYVYEFLYGQMLLLAIKDVLKKLIISVR